MDDDQTHELNVDSSALKGPVMKFKNGSDDLDRRKIWNNHQALSIHMSCLR